MKQWEYKIVDGDCVSVKEMSDIGAEGWELITVFQGNEVVLYFKREIPAESVKEKWSKMCMEEALATLFPGRTDEEVKAILAGWKEQEKANESFNRHSEWVQRTRKEVESQQGGEPEDEDLMSYIGTKVVCARPMSEDKFNAMKKGVWTTDSGRPGYLVIYEDGYRSWSPKDVFERCYRLITEAEKKLI